jgi:hypothetical protein
MIRQVYLTLLLDIEKDFRDCEAALAQGFRFVSITKDNDYFDLMEQLGVLVNNRFKPILTIINELNAIESERERRIVLEAVACGLSEIADIVALADKSN